MSMYRVISCVVGRGCLLWPLCSLGKTLLAFSLLHFVLQGQTCLLPQVSLDFLLLHPSPLWYKGHPHDPTILVLTTHPEKNRNTNPTTYMPLLSPVFIATLVIIAKIWKETKSTSTDEWIKMWCIHIMEYYSSIKQNKILSCVATWMDLENIILSEII